MADGPAIQAANLRSLAAGTKTADVFRIARDFRARHPETPLVLMGYANPMIARGAEWFAAQCAEAGVDGIICVDIPRGRSEIGPALRGMASASSALPRPRPIRAPSRRGRRFVGLYLLRLGRGRHRQAAGRSGPDRGSHRRIKAGTDLPVAVGFGVRTPEQAAAFARHAEGVVVGSALVDLVAQHGANAAGPVRDLTAALADAVHNAKALA
jgi:tryptophan synthase alpha chain